MSGSIDSRLVKRGDTFYAIRGSKVDGHDFLKQASDLGAVEAVVSVDYRGPSFGMQLTPVLDVALELQERARLHLLKNPKRVVAISGSLGKTTTKFFAKSLLEKEFSVWASPKSYNSQLTVPLSILMCPPNVEILILEMGMSEPGQIRRLVEIAPPEVALLTCIALQHVDHFPDGIEGIRREKLSLFSHPKTRLCIHHESIDWKGQPFKVEEQFGLQGPILHNFCAAKAIALAFGVKKIDASSLQMPPMRLEEVRKRDILFINDAYNANADSMIAALDLLAKKEGRKIAVLTEMDALGPAALHEHERVAKKALSSVDLLLCLGKHCETMRPVFEKAGRSLFLFETKQDLRRALKEVVHSGDAVLLKGARKYALEEVLEDY